MQMQSHRSLAKSGSTTTKSRSIAGRISLHRGATQFRGPSRTLAPKPFSAERALESRIAPDPPHSPSTLLPWADPYIADLHRRHEGELRRERGDRD